MRNGISLHCKVYIYGYESVRSMYLQLKTAWIIPLPIHWAREYHYILVQMLVE